MPIDEAVVAAWFGKAITMAGSAAVGIFGAGWMLSKKESQATAAINALATATDKRLQPLEEKMPGISAAAKTADDNFHRLEKLDADTTLVKKLMFTDGGELRFLTRSAHKDMCSAHMDIVKPQLDAIAKSQETYRKDVSELTRAVNNLTLAVAKLETKIDAKPDKRDKTDVG